MDTELLNTFLEINRTKHFGRAAANLYLTQSAVSARMRLLEQAIGRPLLTRSRNDIQLTPAGRKLLPHAEHIVNRWTQAQQEVVLHENERVVLLIAAVLPVFDLLFGPWVKSLWDDFPDVGLSIDILNDLTLGTRLLDRSIDLAITFDPPSDSGLKTEKLEALHLQLMSTTEGTTVEEAMGSNYVFIDWGAWFSVAHAKYFPDYVIGGLRLRSPKLAFELLEDRDGACFLPVRLGSDQTKRLDLFPVDQAPIIEHSAYAVYAADQPNRQLIERVLAPLLGSEGP